MEREKKMGDAEDEGKKRGREERGGERRETDRGR